MAAKKIRVGIIGASAHGSWGTSAHLPALRALPDYEVTAVCTTRQETADETAKLFDIPYAFADPKQLADHPEVDVVTVCARVPTHYGLVTAALNAGKHVFCEWPLGADTAQAEAMSVRAERSGVCHIVGLQARGDPVLNYVKDLIAQGYVGRLLSCTMVFSSANWDGRFARDKAYLADRANGATFLSIPGGHSIDAFCYCLGEFRELSATLATQRRQATIVESGETFEMTSADQVVVNGILESGAVAAIHIKGGIANPAGFLLEINGTDGDLTVTGSGTVQYGDLTLRGAQGRGRPLAAMVTPAGYRRVPAAVPNGPPLNVAQLYAGLAEGINVGTPIRPDFATAVARHRLLDAIQAGSDTGRDQVL